MTRENCLRRLAQLVFPVLYGNKLASIHRRKLNFVLPVGVYLQYSLVKGFRTNEVLTDKVTTLCWAHLTRFGDADLDGFAMSTGAYSGKQKVAIVFKVWVLPSKKHYA